MICWSCAVLIVTVLYVLFDVNYFIRIAWTIGIAKFFQKKIKVTDGSTIYGLCTTNDIDIFLRHMNNARFIRELDFARFDYYYRTGIYREVARRKGNALQSASSIRYRRTIPIFTPYKVTTKLVSWDDKAFYLEQQFITISDQFVRAVILSKQQIIGVNVDELVASLIGNGNAVKRPPIPAELTHWLNSIEVSSEKLRKKE